MAVGGADNPCWLDLLEKGRDSVFANMFDIDWEPAQPNLRDKVLVPLLGAKPHDVIMAGGISLVKDEGLGKYAFAYGEHRFPLRKEDYEEVAVDLAAANAPRAAGRAARAAEFPPRLLARRGRAHQLAPLLRHRRARGAARRG